MRSKGAVVAAALVACLTLIACTDDEEPEAALPTPTGAPTPTPEPTCPLTGAEIPSGTKVERPAVAVKIENSPSARPQNGLENADVVYEEVVEGGITRFMAIFHCTDDDHAGPVRSARFDDPKLARPFTRLLAFSGANSIVESELSAQGIVILNEDSGPAFFRDPPGFLETHNLFVNTRRLRALAPKKARVAPPDDIFTFGELPPKAKRARRVTINFHSANTIEYRWKGGAWKRWEAGSPFVVDTGEQVAVTNVLIQEVRVDNSATIVDVAGNPSPDIRLKGSGRVLLFRDGKVVKGLWTIKKEGDPPAFTTRSGQPLPFAPGSIWIELVPSKEGAVKGSFSFR